MVPAVGACCACAGARAMDSKTKSQPSASDQIKAGEPALTALVRLLARQAVREVTNADVTAVVSQKQK